MENLNDIVRDCFIDLIDEGYIVQLSGDSSFRIGTDVFEQATKIIEFTKKSNEPIIVERIHTIWITNDKSFKKVYNYNDFVNINSLITNSVSHLAHELNIDINKITISIDHMIQIKFVLDDLEIKNISNLHKLIQMFNYTYKGLINIMINMKHGKLTLNAPKKIKEDTKTFENILNYIRKDFDLDIQGNRVDLIPRFEWFRKLD